MVANFDNGDKKNLEKAVALKYNAKEDPAPKVVAKGRGELAARIKAVAEEHGIPIKTDADLVEILEKVDLDDTIPLEVYAVVAEIFAYLYKVNKAQGQKNKGPQNP